MCMDDFRIGRKLRTAVRPVNVSSVSPNIIVSFNASRTHLSFGTQGGNVGIGTKDIDLTGAAGYVVGRQVPKLEFDIQTDGDIVTKEWTGFVAGADQIIVITETYLDET